MEMPTEVRTVMCIAIRALRTRAFKRRWDAQRAELTNDLIEALLFHCGAMDDTEAAETLAQYFGITPEEIASQPPLAILPNITTPAPKEE